MKYLIIVLPLILVAACKKETVNLPAAASQTIIADSSTMYVKYSIFKGNHYCDKSTLKIFTGDQINFKVKFDSTAIYTTNNSNDQGDINKLYGFSEGADNHVNSARIGWAWYKNSLRLYAYVYASGKRNFKEITTVAIGKEICCSIKISANKYLFSANEKSTELSRSSKEVTVSGFQQYPYFGGDETAPHNIFIYIRDLNQ